MTTLALPRAQVATLPTPLQLLPRLSEVVGVELWCKRDDLTGCALGGNKARKLDFLVGDALALGCDTLLCAGGPSSNMILQASAAGARFGLRVVLLLFGSPPGPAAPNVVLAQRLGATVVWTGSEDRASCDAQLPRRAAALEREGCAVYVLPRGGATGVGALGYAFAADELLDQCAAGGIEPAEVLLAVGSSGTAAGLVLGLAQHADPPLTVGITVSRPVAEAAARIDDLGRDAARVAGLAWPQRPALELDDRFLGSGYGAITPEADAAVLLAGRLEGLLLDPTYTAKAMAGLLQRSLEGRLRGPVVFLHTGGAGDLLQVDA